MLNQTMKNLEHLDLISFRKRGVIQSNFNSKTVWLGYGENVTGKITFFRNNFFKKDYNFYTPQYLIKTNIPDLLLFLAKYEVKYFLDIVQNLDDQYLSDVNMIKGWIQSGNIQKMVAVTSETYSIADSFDPLAIIFNLAQNLSGSLYGDWSEDYGIIGITPEPLYVCDKETCFTYALAGTISKSEESYKSVLLNDPKEMVEHKLVIDDLVKKLKDFSSNIKVLNTETIDFGHLAHLKTKIEFDLNSDLDSQKLTSSLSPSAALGGFPAQSVNKLYPNTKHFQLMGEQRVFGGCIGMQYNNYNQSLVMIRNLQWNKKQMWIESGSGIVEKSNPENELKEVIRKRETIKKAISK